MPVKFKRVKTPESAVRVNLVRRLETIIRNIDEVMQHEMIYNAGLDVDMNDALHTVGRVLDTLPPVATMMIAPEK